MPRAVWISNRLALIGGTRHQSNALAFSNRRQGAHSDRRPRRQSPLFDFEPAAKAKIPVAHWGYLMTGTDDDGTIRANREGFTRYDLRVRRLVDVRTIDASVEILGVKWDTPIVINPIGSQKAFHAQGELAVARAAKTKGHLMVLSTVATSSIEDVIAARGQPVWYQLYHRQDWNQTKQMLKRAESAGAPAVVFTVDECGAIAKR